MISPAVYMNSTVTSTAANSSDQPPFHCPSPSQDSPALLGFKASLYVLIITVSLVGNILTICVIYRNRRMRNAVNYLIVNMAVADLLVASLNMVNTTVALVRRSPEWTVPGLPGVALCKILGFMFGFTISCSILNLTAIAAERFVAILFPLKRLLETSQVKYIGLVIWLASLVSVSPLLYATNIIEVDGSLYCGENWGPLFDPVRSPEIFTVVYFALMYALPLFIITILYSCIVIKVWFRKIPGNATGRTEARQIRTRKKVLRMLLTVVVVFALCWLPLHINMFLMYVVDKFAKCGVPKGVSFFALFLGHSNSAINPCLYLIFNEDFRRGFKDILLLCIPKKQREIATSLRHWNASTYNLKETEIQNIDSTKSVASFTNNITNSVELKRFRPSLVSEQITYETPTMLRKNSPVLDRNF